MAKTHERYYFDRGVRIGPFVHVRFRPSGRKAKTRWYWAFECRPQKEGLDEIPVYSVVDQYGDKPWYEVKGGVVELTEVLVGYPIDERPAGLSLFYGEMEEL